MNQRPIYSTPNRQHTTNLNHTWQGEIKTNGDKLTKRWGKRLIGALIFFCGDNLNELEDVIDEKGYKNMVVIMENKNSFRITFDK